MANWCKNRVEFLGEHSQFLKIFFEGLAAKERRERKGQLPLIAKGTAGFLFEISWEEGVLHYLTKWTSNIETMKKVADHFDVGFVYEYSESGNLVYGEATYKDGIINDISLEQDDFDHFTFNSDTGAYEFEGENYESSEDIMKILLERKKALDALQR